MTVLTSNQFKNNCLSNQEVKIFKVDQQKTTNSYVLTCNDNNNYSALISYRSLIAIKFKDTVFISDYYLNYSVSTTRHINYYASGCYRYIVDHDIIVDIYNGLLCLDYDRIYNTIKRALHNDSINKRILKSIQDLNNNTYNYSLMNSNNNNSLKNRFKLVLRFNNIDYKEVFNNSNVIKKELKTRYKLINTIQLNDIKIKHVLTYDYNNILLNEYIKEA